MHAASDRTVCACVCTLCRGAMIRCRSTSLRTSPDRACTTRRTRCDASAVSAHVQGPAYTMVSMDWLDVRANGSAFALPSPLTSASSQSLRTSRRFVHWCPCCPSTVIEQSRAYGETDRRHSVIAGSPSRCKLMLRRRRASARRRCTSTRSRKTVRDPLAICLSWAATVLDDFDGYMYGLCHRQARLRSW